MTQSFIDQDDLTTRTAQDRDNSGNGEICESLAIDEQGEECITAVDKSVPEPELSDLLSRLEEPAPPQMLGALSVASSTRRSPTRPQTDMQQQVLNIVNSVRQKKGLSKLTLNTELVAAAQAHSKDMAKRRRMSHTGSDGSNVGTRAKRHGYQWRTVAENVAAGQSSASAVMKAWMNSTGHRQNILSSKYRDIGIGLAYSNNGNPYWTQVFGAKR